MTKKESIGIKLARAFFLRLEKALAQETHETKTMLQIYQRYVIGQASSEEMRRANQQFRSVLKSMGFGVLLLLPFSPITLPFAIKLGHKFGINILPDSMKKK
jgi:hypothetical protein